MCGESINAADSGIDAARSTVNANLLMTIQNPPAQCALGLMPDKQNRRFIASDIQPEMVLVASRVTHPGRSKNDARCDDSAHAVSSLDLLECRASDASLLLQEMICFLDEKARKRLEDNSDFEETRCWGRERKEGEGSEETKCRTFMGECSRLICCL